MRNRSTLLSYLLLLGMLLLIALSAAAYSQTPDYITNSNLRGVVPFGSYQFGDIDNVNLGTGTLNLKIPILSRKGRGMDYQRFSIYSSKMWEVEPRYDPITQELIGIAWYPNQSAGGWPSGPLQGHLEFNVKDYACESDESITEHVAYNFIYFSPDGAQTRFPNRDHWSTRAGYQGEGWICGSSPVMPTDFPVGQSESGVMELDTTNSTYVLRFKDGRTQTFLNRAAYGDIKDTNGNYLRNDIIQIGPPITVVYETDTAGRRYKEEYAPTGYLTAYIVLTQIDASGNSVDANGSATSSGYRVDFASIGPPITTQFQSSSHGTVFQWSGSLGGLSSITLPNGKSYGFSYDSQFGEMTHIDLPTGGSIDYTYVLMPKFDENPSWWSESLDSRRIASRTLNDGLGHSYTWYYGYSRGWTGDPTGYVTTVTDPNGNVTVHYFDDRGIHEMATDFRDGASTTKRTVTNQWTSDGGPISWPDADATMELDGLRDYRIVSTTTKLLDVMPNLVSLVETTYDTFTYSYGASNLTGTRMNVASTKEYDYGSGGAGGLVRRTVNAYLTDSNYQSRHIVDRLLSRKVYSDLTEGSLKAKTEYEYDSSDPWATGTSGAAQHDDTNYGSEFRYRGNLTRTKTWLDTYGIWLTTTNWYDDLGNRIKTQEPRFNGTGTYTYFYYADSWTNSTCAPLNGNGSYLFVTHIQNALGQHSYSSYNSCQGQVGSTTDLNGRLTEYAYDAMERITSTIRPDGGRTSYEYDDNARKITIWGDKDTPNDRSLKSEVIYDGLERTAERRQYEPGGCYISVSSQYDGFGRVTGVTNPYRPTCSESPVWTWTPYDYLGRISTVTTADGAVARNTYVANKATSCDQAQKQRRNTTDALGRLSKVEEMVQGQCNNTSVYATTEYGYSVLDQLQTVLQSGQTRTFTYDSAGRLKSAANPESGATQYEYDANGNLTQRLDARGVYTWYNSPYDYDNLNRIRSRSYSDGTPAVTYTYDGSAALNKVGRLASISSSVSTYTYDQYDVMGRALQTTQTTGAAYPMTYAYNLAGQLTTQTYPSGRIVTTAYDTAARIDGLTGYRSDEGNKTYASTFVYWPHGVAKSLALGNGRWEHTQFNIRLQPWIIGLGTSSTDSSLLGLTFGYGTTDNNGNLQSQQIAAPGGWNQTQIYSYDDLNRLTAVTEGTSLQNYGYDQYGNRWVAPGSYMPTPSLTPQSQADFNAANNRLVASGYDSAGNQQTDALSRRFDYDAENRQKSYNWGATTYEYDGEGRRVRKAQAGAQTVFVYDALGRLLAEYSNQSSEMVGTRFLTQDHLGSTRVVTSMSGAVISRHDYLPFGEEIGADRGSRNLIQDAGVYTYGAFDATPQKFSGKERDAESGLDYFLARYYSGPQGRFTSPDPENAGSIPTDPQSWNAYAYSRNNPLAFTDPNGKRYRVSWDGGSSEEMSDPEYEDYKSQYIDPIGYIAGGGIIYQKGVKGFVRLGTVQYLMSDKMWALIHGMELAKPAVDALAIGTGIITGGLASLEFIAGGTALTTLSIPAATLPPLVSNPTLQSIVNKLFQVTDKLPGGTAGAVRYELATGDLMSPSGHSRKAQEVIVALTNLLKGGKLSYNDQIVSRQIIQELSDALKTQPRR